MIHFHRKRRRAHVMIHSRGSLLTKVNTPFQGGHWIRITANYPIKLLSLDSFSIGWKIFLFLIIEAKHHLYSTSALILLSRWKIGLFDGVLIDSYGKKISVYNVNLHLAHEFSLSVQFALSILSLPEKEQNRFKASLFLHFLSWLIKINNELTAHFRTFFLLMRMWFLIFIVFKMKFFLE